MAVGFHPLSFSLYPFKPVFPWKHLSGRIGFERQLMRQLEYVQILYAFHFDSLPRTSTKHEHGSYDVPWNSRNIEMSDLISCVSSVGFVAPSSTSSAAFSSPQ